MGMLKIDAYNLRDVQHFLHLCQIAETEGITDLRFVRAALQANLESRAKSVRTSAPNRKASRAMARELPKALPCPDCGKPTVITHGDGQLVRVCPSCRWSRIEGGN